jgi:hypothetical protein
MASEQTQTPGTSRRKVLFAGGATLLGVGGLVEWYGRVSNPEWQSAPTPDVAGVEAASYAALPEENTYQVRLLLADGFEDVATRFTVRDRVNGYVVPYTGQEQLSFASTYPEFSVAALDADSRADQIAWLSDALNRLDAPADA